MCGKSSKFPPIDATVRPARDPADAYPGHGGYVIGAVASISETPAIVVGASPKVRAALDAIQEVLIGFDRDAKDLWAILTALRGPDSTVWATKDRATVRVRRAAFPRLAELYYMTAARLADFGVDGPLDLALATRVGPDEAGFSTHFEDHIAQAVRALTRVTA